MADQRSTIEKPMEKDQDPVLHISDEDRQDHYNGRRGGNEDAVVFQKLEKDIPSPKYNKRRNLKRTEDSILAVICTWIVDHQIGLAANLLLLLALTHICLPRARQHTRKFFDLSYYDASTGRYALGWDDTCMVSFWIVVFTGLRVAVMEYILAPLAQYGGIRKGKDKLRFAEQAWMLTYYCVFWTLGMYIFYKSDYWLNLDNLWADWPDREMDGLFKWYYLVQFAFWIQQICVVNIEERRKDHWQMFTHHIITCSLMLSSYGYHQTKTGNVILCIMDCVDIILPLAKILKYLNYKTACDIAFGVFMVVWFVTRHIIYGIVTYTVYSGLPKAKPYGCYWGGNGNIQGPIPPPDRFHHLTMPFRDPKGLVCTTHKTTMFFVTLLLLLQVLLVIWFGMIVRVAWRVIGGVEADDPRSDEEDEVEADDKMTHYFEEPPLEEEVGVEAINLTSRHSSPTRKYRKGGVTASGVTLPSDRKELLGRIGCDKGS